MTSPSNSGQSNRSAFRFPTPSANMESTGERYVSGLVGDIQSEHYHRYLFALNFCDGKDVLDVASGEGYGSALLAQAARSVIGVDLSVESVRFANAQYLSERLSFRQGDATALPIADASVDVVVSFETIEHLSDHALFLREIRRVLRLDGVLVISSPDQAIYDEGGKHENPFHLKELGRAEFLALMQGAFPHVVLSEQRALHGSVILRAAETGRGERLEGFETPDGTLFERASGVPTAPYLLAVCSSEALVVPDSVMQTPRLLWHMEEMRQREAAQTAAVREEHRQSLAQEKALQRQIQDGRRQVQEGQQQLQDANKSLLAALEAGRRAQATSDELAHRLGEADADRRSLRGRLDDVLGSTSWRLTAPLRAILRRMPRLARALRGGIKLVWWTVSFQLFARLEARREFLARAAAAAAAATVPETPPPVSLIQPQEVIELPVPDGRWEWASHAPMADLLRKAEQERLAAASPDPVAVVEIEEDELERVVAGLSFPESDQPLVSIIVPVFNNVVLTVECLESVRRHGGDIPYEVILADDASTDRTAELLAKVPGLVYQRNAENLHFLRNCNLAARKARGEFLLLLNNDVQVTEGWLRPLVDLFRNEPKAGAVGPRIVYPSGFLQEAGVRIEPDVSSRLIGLNDDPGLDRYAFNRRVDYCSGAALMLRRSTWESLGGFDEALAPAYCEDLELCLRLHNLGLDIWYVADSTVVHHLSRSTASTGTDAKMRMIVANQQKVAERWQPLIDQLNEVRLFAFYLPQFHPIPENDRWWGTGFTEWSNVTRAVPQYPGHYQPQLPSTLGFYDLRLPAVMAEQARLARRHGIEAFCFYYYWFAGHRLLEHPIEQMLKSGEPDFPFFLCWANENWTRRWDGQDAEILMGQSYSQEDSEAMIRDIMRYMRDRRYVRVNGKPILLVYRVELIPEFEKVVERWRDLCRAEGIGEIYVAAVESFEHSRSSAPFAKYGLDASVQFPPHGDPVPDENLRRTAHADFAGHIYDYEASAVAFSQRPFPSWPRFPTVMPGWDNTARRMKAAAIFNGATPGAFQAWLETAIEQTSAHNAPGERIVFINAWNEWAEGAQLEPDRMFGHARLEAVQGALQSRMLGREGDA